MKIVKMLLVWMMLILLPLTAWAEPVVELAAVPVDAAQFEHYPSFVEENGRWSVNAIQADALLQRFFSEARSESCVFHLAVEGNAQTGVWSPVIRFYLMDEATNAKAVSILADGVRFDLAAFASTLTRNRQTVEVITAPLTAEAAQALEALLTAETVSIRLLGEDIYTTKLDSKATGSTAQLEAQSLKGLEAGFALWQEAGLSAYGLWDLSADAWESLYGFRPAFAQTEVHFLLRDAEIEDDFGMIVYGERGDAVEAARAILTENGFLSERSASSFTTAAVEATLRAQRYLGLIETGCVDAQFEEALAAGRVVEEAAAPALSALGTTAEVALERYWFASAVSARANEQSQRSVLNSDHRLLVADGFIRNISPNQLHLFMQMEASVICNGSYAYEAELVCECNEGTGLDTLLLPLGESRLIVYAEVPAALAQGGDWSIQLTANGESLVFDLQ